MPIRGSISKPPIDCVTGFGKSKGALRSRRTISAGIFSAPLNRGARRQKQSIVQALPRIRGAAPGYFRRDSVDRAGRCWDGRPGGRNR